jgi:hypothetical protein
MDLFAPSSAVLRSIVFTPPLNNPNFTLQLNTHSDVHNLLNSAIVQGNQISPFLHVCLDLSRTGDRFIHPLILKDVL